ncbi:MAG: DUF3892 domain-containing protein [Blastochloris viridis]|uniref:DUF3892 domain-containing protein n=1 Tax=Blastochloris viridis TaxID=1079 RepID=A0A6N4RFR4_BLAVI|nr:MAG: DUF3892 domain-containing protein [Blastochloris viridis]
MAEYQVTHIRLSNGTTHQHITQLAIGGQWYTRQQVVDFIRSGHSFYTQVYGGSKTYLKVVDATPPYVQTFANNTPTDNLLSLPKAA